jgi:ATP-dependent protease ClpP protease subunit
MKMATEYRLAFGVHINHDAANNLRRRIASILERPDFGALTILFSSEGGGTDYSLELFNFISGLPVPVHMHGIGHIGSAAVPVFMAGTRRTCSSFSRFFFHEYDWGFSEHQTLHRIDEAVQRLRSDIALARQIISSRSKVPTTILDTLDGSTPPAIVDPQAAKAYGLVEDVCELDKSGSQEMTVAVWNV